MKTINIILTVLFVIFAAVQLNDPDPWLWVLIYGLVAVITGMAAMGRVQPKFLLGAIIACGIGIALYLPDFVGWLQMGTPTITGSMKAESPHVELVREFLGLVIVFLVLVWEYRSVKKL